ncbi:MAG: radical SAM protein [Thermodesulfovibrionales bacterium]
MKPIYPNIPEFMPTYNNCREANIVQHWGFFDKQELIENMGRLLMLDIDFGRKCSLNCPTCFRKNNSVDDDTHNDLDYDRLLNVIKDARNIGLKSIKICGAGEPLEHPLILRFARDLTDLGIGIAIFTKGHILGDDMRVADIFGSFGIKDAFTLCQAFYKLKTSFLVSFQSAYYDIQNQLVGSINGYSLKRNRALELLAEAGFNKTIPTRLAVCSNPITNLNYREIFDIYVYSRKRNILPVTAALMVSGKQFNNGFLHDTDVTDKEKEELFLQIYEYNLKYGYSTKEQLLEEGISCLPGIHPCNQIAAGLYLTSNGNVIRCPGDSGKPLGNVQEEGIVSIWNKHKDWEYRDHFNCYCPYKDGISLPSGIYERTMQNLVNVESAKQ